LPPPEKIVGIIGKTNVGKSTLFAALTLATVDIANHPFTTIKPNIGIGYVRKKCVHVELGLPQCNPRSGYCLRGNRFIPIKLMDVVGLIPGASKGRGLGNKFMDDLRQADALIHVVDAAGATDPEGNPVRPGTSDPVEEVVAIQKEVDTWFYTVVKRLWNNKISRHLFSMRDPLELLVKSLSGLSITKYHVLEAIRKAGLEDKRIREWRDEDIQAFSKALRSVSKPIIVAANKADLPAAYDNIKRLKREFGEERVIPISALAEYILRKAALNSYIVYIPGDPEFRIISSSKLTREQKKALELIEDKVLKRYGSTGVQQLINSVVFNILRLIVVYPVENHNKYTDHHGNVLPDAYLVQRDTTVRDLAYMVHTDLGNSFLYAINAKTGERVGENYVLEDNDVIKIVAAKAR